MEAKGSLLRSQDPSTGPHPEPDHSSPYQTNAVAFVINGRRTLSSGALTYFSDFYFESKLYRRPLVGEVSATFCGLRGGAWLVQRVFICSMRLLLVAANVVPSSSILVTLMMEALTRATRRNIPEDGNLQSPP
jgi:hypothetical protein